MFSEREIENLDFLCSLSENALAKWYAQASEDDIAYAQELLDRWETELVIREAEIRGSTMVGLESVTVQ